MGICCFMNAMEKCERRHGFERKIFARHEKMRRDALAVPPRSGWILARIRVGAVVRMAPSWGCEKRGAPDCAAGAAVAGRREARIAVRRESMRQVWNTLGEKVGMCSR
jgi:hypothetical protein